MKFTTQQPLFAVLIKSNSCFMTLCTNIWKLQFQYCFDQ